MLMISPILCPIHEDTPGPAAPDLAALAEGRLAFVASGDPAEVKAGTHVGSSGPSWTRSSNSARLTTRTCFTSTVAVCRAKATPMSCRCLTGYTPTLSRTA